MEERAIQTTDPRSANGHRADLREELAAERERLAEAEASLAKEQAAVNAFRLHCRLKLDDLVDRLEALREEHQIYLTRWQLLGHDGCDRASPYDEGREWDDKTDGDWEELEDESFGDDELPLPSPTPQDKAAEKRLYRELARRFHPDLANTSVERTYRTSVMVAVNSAYAARDVQALYDLAGELDPVDVAELEAISVPRLRKLREQILKMRRRRRKILQRHKALRQDKTARLWRTARQLENKGSDWWQPVRLELQEEIRRRERVVKRLKQRLSDYGAAEIVDATVEGKGE